MKKGSIQFFLLNSIVLILISVSFIAARNTADQYKCLPCGQSCDNATYDKPGKCSHCQMDLVKASTIVFKTIQPSEICSYIQKHPGVVLLDVRTKEEFEGKADPNFGSLKNAINVPIQELEKRLPAIAGLKNKEVIVYCSHSHRSPCASYLLTQNGFTNVTNMAGGMSVMKDNGCKNNSGNIRTSL